MRRKRGQASSSVDIGTPAPNGREAQAGEPEERLREYLRLVEGVEEMIAVVDRDYRYLVANHAFLKQRGMKSEQVLGRRIAEVFNQQLFEQVLKPKLDECFQGKVVRFELNHIYPEIGERVLSVSYFPIEGPQRVDRVACILQDITEQRRAEELLRQSESQLIEAQHLAQVGSWSWDLETNLGTWSTELFHIFGLDPGATAPTYEGGLAKYVHPDDQEFFRDTVENSLRSGEPCSFLYRIVRPDGQERIVHSQGNIVADKDGKPVRMFGTVQDVTEQKLAERALREAEKKYRDIFENAVGGIFQTTPDGRTLTANPALANMLGFESAAELISIRTNIGEQGYVQPAQRAELKGLLDQRGVVQGFEFECYRKDGSKIWISESVRAVRDARGELLYYEGTVEDITNRRLAEAALRESEERFSKAFHSSPAPLIITRLFDGCFLNANDAFLRAFEYERAEVIGNTVQSLNIYVNPEDRRNLIDKLQEQGALRGVESQAQTKSGRILDLLVFVEPIRLEGEQCLLSTAYDITQRRRVEEALRQSEERYRELFENAKDATYVHDLKGVYTSVNRAAEKLSGRSREEILGKPCWDFVAPEYRKQLRENLCKKLKETGETNYEVEMINRNGARVPVEVSSRLIYENGVAIGVQGSARDITEPKRARQALLTYSRRLIEAQEVERGRIARELHDQIGQMLTALKLNLHAIESALDAPEACGLIQDNLAMLDEALEQVRDLSIDLRPLLLDDFGLPTALNWYVDHQAQRSGVRAEFTIDSLDPDLRFSPEVETACFRIVQEALTNVVRHAQAKLVTVRLSRNGQHLNLYIKDDGVGFDLESLRRHAASATLGLRGMEERARALGGRVRIESAKKKGTQVFAELPITLAVENLLKTWTVG